MDNHLHLILDANGADISKIMHCINFKYARYYNTVHKRHGHLFQDRFKSKIVKDERYLIALSAYIHNNPMDIKGYEDCPEKYYFSSLAVYLKFRKDPFDVLEEEYILSILGRKKSKSREVYMKLVMKVKTLPLNYIIKEEAEFEYEKTEYRSERRIIVRNFNIQNVIKYISEIFKIERALIHLRYQKELVPARAVLVVLLRRLCNLTQKDICGLLGNITGSRVSKLSSLGAALIRNDERYKNIIGGFMDCYC
jgi:hypothetical protein